MSPSGVNATHLSVANIPSSLEDSTPIRGMINQVRADFPRAYANFALLKEFNHEGYSANSTRELLELLIFVLGNETPSTLAYTDLGERFLGLFTHPYVKS